MSTDDIQVSVIMPAYNAEGFIAQAIESVINQTRSDWELIIVDDCSEDRTAAITNSYVQKDPRIVFLQHQQNQGVAAARNSALGVAQGDYIAFLDSDDYWLSNKLEKQLAFMVDRGALICCSNYRRMDEKGNVTISGFCCKNSASDRFGNKSNASTASHSSGFKTWQYRY